MSIHTKLPGVTLKLIRAKEHLDAIEDIYDGARLIGFPLNHPSVRLHRDLQVLVRACGFLAFQEPPVPGEEPSGVVAALDAIWEFVANDVVFAVEPFVQASG
jgi:hypothetical protein